MSDPAPNEPRGLRGRLLDAAEELIYQMNERNHWLFRVYDAFNELWASLVFRGVRRRAAEIDLVVSGSEKTEARLRFLTEADDEVFTELMASLSSKYLPPHPIDAATCARSLRRRSYLPFGIFVDDRLVGYLLQRLFFPRRAITGIWTRPHTHNLGIAQACLRHTGRFSTSQGLADYATVPVDNLNSVRVANGAGWRP